MDTVTITESEIMQALEEAFAGDEKGDRWTTADIVTMTGRSSKWACEHIKRLIVAGKAERAGTIQGESLLTGARTNTPAFRLRVADGG